MRRFMGLLDAKRHFDRNERSDWVAVRAFGGPELPLPYRFDGALLQTVAGLPHYRNIFRSAVRGDNNL